MREVGVLARSVRVSLASLCLCLALAGQAAEGRRLSGHVPAAAGQLTAGERLPARKVLRLAIGLSLRHEEGLTALLQELYDPASPKYRQWLTREQFTERFGPTEHDYQAVVDFAQAHGLTVTVKHPNRLVLDVEGAVADIEQALHVTLRTYSHPTEGRTFYAPDNEPMLDLGVPVLHVAGLDDYSLPHPNSRIIPMVKAADALPNTGSGANGAYLGADFRAAYVPDTALTGNGQSVGLLQFDGYYAADIARYEIEAGLPEVPLVNVAIDGGVEPPGNNNSEVCLDIETALSMAPGLAAIYVYEAPNGSPWVDLLSRMANDNLAKQLSCSWGGGGADPTCEAIFQQMAAQGQSFFNAAGDSDAFCGAIGFPAESTNITQVGGTTLRTTGPQGDYVSETVWNWGLDLGGSGGISTRYGIPAYQIGLDMTANQGSTTMRNIPDVALTADNVYVTYDDGESDRFGGTSCAAPLWAGFIALVNERATANGRPTVGLLNPAIYAIGRGGGYTNAFHDITAGNNFNTCSPTQFSAVAGYDLCTGWGTPAGSGLIDTLAGPADALQVTPADGFAAAGPPGGPFAVTTQTFRLTNAGAATLNWSLVSTSLWLTVSPSNGSLQPGANATDVTFRLNTAATNAPPGAYSASAWFWNMNKATVQRRDCTLLVLGAPVITAQPSSQTVPAGGAAGFSVGLTGAPPLSLSWQRNGSPIPGATQATYALSGAQLTDSGSQFSCLASNAYGVTHSAVATLYVDNSLVRNGGFETGDFTDWTLLTLGGQVTLLLKYVHSGTYGLALGSYGRLGSFYQNLPTTPGSNYLVSLWFNNPSGATPNEFQVTWDGAILYDGVDLSVLGWTNLQFLVTASRVSSTLGIGYRHDHGYAGLDDLRVVPADGPRCLPPAIVCQPSSQAVSPGSNVTFVLGATGAAPLGYAWQRNGWLIPGATQSSYSIFNVQPGDTGSQFNCLVSNAYGTALSSAARLTVPPLGTGLIAFDDLPATAAPVPAGYQGLNWDNFFCMDALNYSNNPSGYGFGVMSGSNVVYNASGAYASLNAAIPFDLLSAWLTAAWNDYLQVEALGYVGSRLTYDTICTLSATGPTLVNFNHHGVTKVDFFPSGGIPHLGYSYDFSGSRFAMDNVVIRKGSAPAFVPGSLALSTNGQFQFQLAGTPGSTCEILVGSDLSNWTVLRTLFLVGATTNLLDDSTNVVRRFYRARLVLP